MWTEDAQKAFEALKEVLTSPPILAMPNDSGFYILDTDATEQTIGAVLSQIQDGVDHFSKWAEAIPLRNHTASTVARALVMQVLSKFGSPLELLSDRGPKFESELFKELLKWMEIDKLRTTVFHPSCNGVVERFHRTLNYMLRKAASESQRDWDEKLPLVLAAYRATRTSPQDLAQTSYFWGMR